jgi:hypothetical protein
MLRSGIIAVVVAVPAIPALTSQYAFSDDYTFLGYEQSAKDLVRQVAGRDQRPLAGVFCVIGRQLVGTIDGLGWVRLVGLAGAVALALATATAARSAGFSERFALALSLGVGLLPSVQLYAAWATLAPCGWVSAASMFASQRLVRSHDSPSLARRLRVGVLLIVSALTYQPSVGFFIVGLVLALLSPQPRHNPRDLVAMHASALSIAVSGVIVWIAIARLTINDGFRTRLTQRPGRKLSWFSTEVLDNATNTFDITPSHFVKVLVVVVIAALIAVVTRQRSKQHGRRQGAVVAAVLVLAMPITYTPNLVVDETWAAYRTLAALSALVLIFLLVAAREVAQLLARQAAQPSARRRLDLTWSVAIAVGIMTAGGTVATTMHRELIDPQTKELAAFRAALRATYSDSPTTVAVRQLVEPRSPPARYDEFGVPSLAKEWVPVGFAHSVYRADGRDPNAQRVVRLPPGEVAPPGATVIEVSPPRR